MSYEPIPRKRPVNSTFRGWVTKDFPPHGSNPAGMRSLLLRGVVSVAAVSIVLMPVSASAQVIPPQAFSFNEQVASSAWIQREDGTPWFYFAVGGRGLAAYSSNGGYPLPGARTGELIGFGVVGRGRCQVYRHGMSCFAKGRPEELGPQALTFDPLMGSVEMDMPNAGHHILWTGLGDHPEPSIYLFGDLVNLSGGASLARGASIEGSIYGQTLQPRRPRFSSIRQGTRLEVFPNLPVRVANDGTFSLRLSVRTDGWNGEMR